MLTDLTPMEHFRDLVTKAIRGQGVETSELVEFYLSNLLAEFIDPKRLSGEPLATKFLKALGAEGELRGLMLKELGDLSLFISGFFSDSLKRRLIDVDYYIAMGATSYGHLAAETPAIEGNSRSQCFTPLYRELSEKFTRFVDVLNEVSERSRLSTSRDVLRIYERWLKTGSRHAEAILRELGITPIKITTRPVH